MTYALPPSSESSHPFAALTLLQIRRRLASASGLEVVRELESALAARPSGFARYWLAWGYLHTDRHLEAARICCEMLDDHGAADAPRQAHLACSLLALIYRHWGDLDQARRFQKRAVLTGDDCDESDLGGLAHDAFLAGKLELAHGLSEMSLALQEVDEDGGAGNEWAMLGLVALRQGRVKKAIRAFRTAYRHHRREGYRAAMAMDLVHLGEIMGRCGRTSREIQLLERARRLTREPAAVTLAAEVQERLDEAVRMWIRREHPPELN